VGWVAGQPWGPVLHFGGGVVVYWWGVCYVEEKFWQVAYEARRVLGGVAVSVRDRHADVVWSEVVNRGLAIGALRLPNTSRRQFVLYEVWEEVL
jgi:hypothetical protein